MSFILQDKNLLKQLLSWKKTAQNAVPDFQKSLARKLINKLQRQYTNVSEPLNISADAIGASLNVSDLQSLDKLLQFLNNNKIKINNEIIVYNGNEYQNLSEQEKNKLSTISAKMSRDAATRKWNESDYFVNMPLMVEYIKYLQDKAATMEKNGDVQGQILRVMVGKLIDSVNSISSGYNLTRNKQKSTPENPNVLSDDAVLDDFNTKTFDSKNPYADRGTNQIKLYAKNLKNREALNSWLLGDEGGEATIIGYDSEGQRIANLFSDEKSNHCTIIQVLYLRAARWLQLSKSEQDTKKYTYYLNKIKELGPEYTDPSGGACSIGGAAAHSQMTALVPKTPNKNTDKDSDVRQTSANMAAVVGDLPFSLREIDFNRIRRFFVAVSKVVGDNQSVSESIQNSIHNVEQYMNQFTALTYNSNVIIPLNINLMQFARLVSKDGNLNAKNVFPALSLLDKILDTTRDVVEAFYSAYGTLIKDQYPNYVPYILGQIGRTPDDSSLYNRNATVLENLRTSGKVT